MFLPGHRSGPIAIPPLSPVKSAPDPRRSDALRGIAFMAAGMFLFSGVDTMGKFLTDTVHPIQIVWFRQLGLFFGVLVLFSFEQVS